MKIHNYGNDYVQARKFKEKISNAGNRIAENEPTSSREVRTEASETPKEGAKTKKASKKKDNTDNV